MLRSSRTSRPMCAFSGSSRCSLQPPGSSLAASLLGRSRDAFVIRPIALRLHFADLQRVGSERRTWQSRRLRINPTPDRVDGFSIPAQGKYFLLPLYLPKLKMKKKGGFLDKGYFLCLGVFLPFHLPFP